MKGLRGCPQAREDEHGGMKPGRGQLGIVPDSGVGVGGWVVLNARRRTHTPNAEISPTWKMLGVARMASRRYCGGTTSFKLTPSLTV